MSWKIELPFESKTILKENSRLENLENLEESRPMCN